MIRQIAVALAAMGWMGVHAQVADNTVVVEAGSLAVTKAEFEGMLADDPRLPVALARPAAKASLGVDFGKAFALEAEARRRHLEQSPAVQLKMRSFMQQLLANELLVSLRNETLKDKALLTQLYEANPTAYAQPRVRHLLVRMQGSQVALAQGKPDLSPAQARARAEALLAKVAAGADFAELAKAESDDAGSIASGGDVGFVARGSTAAGFEAAAYSLPVGQVSKPVQTEFGFHLMRVEERRALPLEVVKGLIANDRAHQEMDRIILNGYKLNTAYFGSP